MAEGFNTEDMLDMYLFENGQLLEQLQDTVLDQKDAECFDEDSINEIFRTMHTIKGSSGIMMFDNITAVSHKLEDVFFYLRESHPDNVPHLELVEHVLHVEDFISNEMEKIRNGDQADGDASDIIAELDVFLNKIKGIEDTADKAAAPQPVNKSEEPKQFYIAPVATSDSHFYRIFINFYSDTEMANIHAYKTVYALKEIAEEVNKTDFSYSQTTINRKVWALRDAEYITSKLKVNKADMFYILAKGKSMKEVLFNGEQ